ncbi:MAG: DUF917 domain-containing protein [Caldilineaceae bacterium]
MIFPNTASDVWSERLARTLAINMGATAGLTGFVMSGKQFREYVVPYTLSLAHQVGAGCWIAQGGCGCPEAVADILDGHILFRGKISDVNRRTTKGFARSTLTVQGYGGGDQSAAELFIEFQNEYLIAYINGRVAATVPDLICIVTEDEGQPVATELLRYGTRVAVLAVPGAAQMKTPRALEVVGPRAFGYDVDFAPLVGGKIGVDLASLMECTI